MRKILVLIVIAGLISTGASCALKKNDIATSSASVAPGESVAKNGKAIQLTGNPVRVGQKIPSVPIVDANTGSDIRLDAFLGNVVLLSLVPSIDTKVCEAQTHYLGEQGDKLPVSVKRITISRDTPFAQKRFAQEAKLTDLTYLSDYKEGAFGRSIGLLMQGPMLLARSIILLDREGIVRYIQVVPEITTIPDMEAAFAKASELAGKDLN